MKSAGKVSTLLIAVLSVLVIFLSVLLLSGSKNAIPAPIDGIYQSAEFPDGSCYTAQFSGDQFHIHWKWSGQEQTILSGLFEVVDEAKGIYLLYDSQENFIEVIVLQEDGFYIIDRVINDSLIYLQLISSPVS